MVCQINNHWGQTLQTNKTLRTPHMLRLTVSIFWIQWSWTAVYPKDMDKVSWAKHLSIFNKCKQLKSKSEQLHWIHLILINWYVWIHLILINCYITVQAIWYAGRDQFVIKYSTLLLWVHQLSLTCYWRDMVGIWICSGTHFTNGKRYLLRKHIRTFCSEFPIMARS